MSLLIILINNPFSIINIGLQLSYGGTIGIICYYKRIYNFLNRNQKEGVILYKKNLLQKVKMSIKEMLSVTFSAQLIIFPIIIINFHTISFSFFISNLLVGYLLGAITIGGFILVFVSIISIKLATVICILIKLLLSILILIAESCAKLPFSKIYVITPNLIFIVVYYIIIALYKYMGYVKLKNNKRFLEKKIIQKMTKFKYIVSKHKKNLFILTITLVTLITLIGKIPKDLKIHFIDVGQGDSCLIITPTNKKILIDAGGNEKNDSFDVGESTIVPYLLSKKIKTLDYIIVSHFDSDHCGRLFFSYKRLKC